MSKLKDILTSKYTYCFVGVIVVWGLSWFLTTLCIGDSQDRGTFGDMFGAVNALFSGLAFAGLIITLIQQRTELELQRNEIQQTREEMAHQSAEFKLQNKTLQYQRFETSFFGLLSTYTANKQKLSFRHSYWRNEETVYEHFGTDVFEAYFEKYTWDSRNGIQIGAQSILRNNSQCLHYIPKYSVIGSHFRFISQIIQFVDKTPLISNEDRNEYLRILTSQMTDYELVLFFYEGLAEESLKTLIEKHALLECLNHDMLASKTHVNLYNETAYNYQTLKN